MRKTREHSVDCRSTSGLVGVTLSMADKAGSLRVHWSARFMEKGKQRNVSFQCASMVMRVLSARLYVYAVMLLALSLLVGLNPLLLIPH